MATNGKGLRVVSARGAESMRNAKLCVCLLHKTGNGVAFGIVGVMIETDM